MNQIKGYIAATTQLARKLQTIKNVNIISKLQNGEYLVSALVAKKNISENTSLDYQNLYSLSGNNFTLLQQGTVVQQNYLTSYSNDKTRFIKVQSLTEESEKPRQVLEIYEKGELLFSINVQKFHDEIINNEMVGEPFKWNKNHDKILYLAKAKPREQKTFFQVEKEEEIPHAWNYRKYEQSWGERMDNIDIFYLYIVDVQQQKLFKVSTPNNLFLTYPQFNEDDNIIFGAYEIKPEFKYGIVHCFNRRSGVYLLENPQLIELPEKQTTAFTGQTILLSKHDVSIKPVISPDFKKVIYFGSPFNHQHLSYLSLNLIDLQSKQIEELVGVQQENEILPVREDKEKRDQINGGVCGYYDQLQQAYWTLDSQQFIYSSLVGGQQIIYGIDVSTKQINRLSHRNKSDFSHNSNIINYDKEHDVLFYTDENINQSPILNALFNIKEKQYQLIENNNQLKVTISKKLKEEYVYSNDSEGYLWYLENDKEMEKQFEIPKYFEKRPLIVIMHGGPHGNTSSIYTQLRHILLSQGYFVLSPNYSGSSSYGQKFIEKLSGKIGELDVNEILDMIAQVKQRFQISKVFAMGGSYGGYLSAIMGSRHHDIFNAAVIMNPVVNLPFMINITDIPEWGSSCALNRDHTWNLSAEDYKILLEKSPMSSPLKIPSLLLLGAKDRRCPYQQSLALRAQALEIGTEIQTYVYPNADHSLADSINTGYDTIFKILLFLESKMSDQ